MCRMLKIVVFLQLVSLGFGVNAVVIEDLFEARVEIADQTQRSQNSAVKDAFKLVLVKVSGNRDLLSDETIRRHIEQARSFLLSYRFDLQPDKIFYLAEFDAQRIEKIIRFAGFSIWDKRRPDSILWLAMQDKDKQQRRLVTFSNQRDNVLDKALQTASRRGVSISFPILDLTDLQAVGVYDVWNGFTQTIVKASGRYLAGFVVSASVFSRQQESWTGQWTIAHKGQYSTGEISADSAASVISELVEILADNQAQLYALGTSDISEEKIKIIVGNINKLTNYVEVSEFLQSLTVVLSATLVEQIGDKGIFELELFGDQGDLENALRLADRMQPTGDQSDQPDEAMSYVWRN